MDNFLAMHYYPNLYDIFDKKSIYPAKKKSIGQLNARYAKIDSFVI